MKEGSWIDRECANSCHNEARKTHTSVGQGRDKIVHYEFKSL